MKDILNKKSNTTVSPHSLNINRYIMKNKKKFSRPFQQYIGHINYYLNKLLVSTAPMCRTQISCFKFSLVSESVISKYINDLSA